MPQRATVLLHPDFRVGEIDRRLFGSFVEHLGRAVYTGIYEPGHDDRRRARVPPRRRRPDPRARREHGPLPRRQLRLQLRLGGRRRPRRGPQAVHRPRLAHHRAQHRRHRRVPAVGRARGHRADDGRQPRHPRRRGRRRARRVLQRRGRLALGRPADRERSREALRRDAVVPGQRDGRPVADRPQGRRTSTASSPPRPARPCGWWTRRIELVVCGSSSMYDGHLRRLGADGPRRTPRTSSTTSRCTRTTRSSTATAPRSSGPGPSMDRFIRRVVASADAVAARRRSDKVITISFDEWNVWYLQSRFPGEQNLPLQRDAPRIIEDVYSALDAVVVGDLMVTLLNHADRVPVACLAQLVNVIAPIMTEPGGPAWRQPTFHPFATTARLARGTALDLRVDGPSMSTTRARRRPRGHRRGDARRVRRRWRCSWSTAPPSPSRSSSRTPASTLALGRGVRGDRRPRARRRGPGARGRRRGARTCRRSTARRRRPAARCSRWRRSPGPRCRGALTRV